MSRPAFAEISLENLIHNYRLLKQRAAGAEIMAIVKADAYGHGLSLIAPALRQSGCSSFGVTDADEGARLRALLGHEATIVVLSGIHDDADAAACAAEDLTPALSEPAQLDRLVSAGFHGQAWIKVDTGMNRLGAEDGASLKRRMQKAGIGLAGILSHLACADTPEHPMNRAQLQRFLQLRAELGPELPASLLNSAGLIALPDAVFDVVRPGIALYGSEPVATEPMGLKPVMRFGGRILQIRDIAPGESVSYGARWTASGPTRVAVVSLGYGDGLPRLLSNRGHALIRGQRCPILGVVCMDYTMVDVSHCECSPGDDAEFWGESLAAHDVADILETISYELFTGVSARVRRIAGP